VAQYGIERPRQFGAGAFQLHPVREGEAAQDRPARGSEPDPDFALVFDARGSRNGATGLKPIHQFNGAVVLDKETRGNLPDGGLYALGKSLDCEQQLVLLRFDVVVFRKGFTEMKELADLTPELGQIAVLIGRKVAVTAHIYIVTRHKLKSTISRKGLPGR
jgi:hypothetical protein